MKWKNVGQFITRIFLLGILVSVVVWVIGFFKNDQPHIAPNGAVSLDFPLKDGSYFVDFSGPAKSFLPQSVHISPNEKYALDISRDSNIKDFFSIYITHKQANNSTFGTKLYSPCVGMVRKTEASRPDLPITLIARTNTPGNNIVIGCDGFDVLFAHVKQNSIVVQENQLVQSGDLIGEIGNSGNSSGPHLHLQATKFDQQGNATPLPMIFNGRYLQRGDIIKN